MGADDRVHRASDLIRGLARTRGIAERNRQWLEETKPARAIAQMTFKNGAPAEFVGGDTGAALALHADLQWGVKLVPVDRCHSLTLAGQNEGVQMSRHRIVET